MDISELMEVIAQEAERQGFVVRQTREATWHFRRDNHNAMIVARSAVDVLEGLRVLVTLGLDWSMPID